MKEEEKNVGKTLTLNDAMIVLDVERINMTKMGLRTAAKRDGFKSDCRGKGREKFLLDNNRFLEWLKKFDNATSGEFVPISFFARKKGISTAYVYVIIRKNRIKTKIFGGGRGKIYINAKQVEKILEKKGGSYKSLVKRVRLSYKSLYEGYEDFIQAII